MFRNYLKIGYQCQHKNINIFSKCGYCPDCGKLVHVKWYFCRCKCCGIKREAVIIFDNILTKTRYCQNCGSKDFIVEEVNDINGINLNYAVLRKESTESENFWNNELIEVWSAELNKKLFLQTGKSFMTG